MPWHLLFILCFNASMKKLKSEPIKTVLVITVGFLFVYMVTKWQLYLTIALIVGLSGISSNYLAEKIDFLWMKLTWLLSLIVPNILLSLVFFLILTPVARLSKLFGETDVLNLKNAKNSLFKDVDKRFEQSSFEKPW